MKSPITGKDMKLMSEKRTLKYKGKEFTVDYEFWLCEDSGEKFTTDELDDKNLAELIGHIPKDN